MLRLQGWCPTPRTNRSWAAGPWKVEVLLWFGQHPACCYLLFLAFRNTSRLFLEAGPQRIGSKYKKVMFVEYEDATFKKRKVSSQPGQGILGPVLKGEVGDQFKVREIAFHAEIGKGTLPPNSSYLLLGAFQELCFAAPCTRVPCVSVGMEVKVPPLAKPQ